MSSAKIRSGKISRAAHVSILDTPRHNESSKKLILDGLGATQSFLTSCDHVPPVHLRWRGVSVFVENRIEKPTLLGHRAGPHANVALKLCIGIIILLQIQLNE